MVAQVTITSTSRDLKNTYLIYAVIGTPVPAQRQVQARLLSSSASGQKTVPTTGVRHFTPQRASGTLEFVNTASVALTFESSVLTGASGVPVTFYGPVTVPAASTVNVDAYAVNDGVSGNIPALDINGPCCVPTHQILVKNPAPFTGGKDEHTAPYVALEDVYPTAQALEPSVTQDAQTALQQQLLANERPVNDPQCRQIMSAIPFIGEIGDSVTVTLKGSSTQVVYDEQGARGMAADLLTAEAMQQLGESYALVSNVATTVTHAIVGDSQGTASIFVAAEGIWAYQFTNAAKMALAGLIVNKSTKDAQILLAQQAGVASATTTLSGEQQETLPADPQQIAIVVQDIAGLQGAKSSTGA
jgi:hypothetical protein